MIYLDNAATSFPKPAEVIRKTLSTLSAPLGNPGRSGHRLSRSAADLVYEARESVAQLLGLQKPERVVFCSGATAALNMAILGSCRAMQKDTIPFVVSSVFEHNSVLRPLFSLEREGKIRLFLFCPGPEGSLREDVLLAAEPDLVVLTCRSNVTGREFPLRHCFDRLRERGTVIILDAAQALGSATIDFESTGADILCAPGHKGLLGIMGGGFLAVRDSCRFLPEPILFGGSGSDSFRPEMPTLLPERLEAGTLPLPAIVSMGTGARFLMKDHNLEAIGQWEAQAKAILTQEIENLPQFQIYERENPNGPLLINHKQILPEEVALALSEQEIMVRAGFHCAPLAHRFLGTELFGAVRLSPGPFSTKKELLTAVDALARL